MRKDLWSLALDQVKKQEKPEAVLVIAGSTELTRVVVAWIGVKISRRKRLTKRTTGNEEAVWLWLWENTSFSQDWLYSRVPGCRKKAEQNFAVLVANRILYPDGSVNAFVARYLRERVLSLFGLAKSTETAA